MEQELLILPEHLSSIAVISRVRVARFLVLCVCFVDRCLSFWPLSFWPLCCLSFFDLRILIGPFGIFYLLLDSFFILILIIDACGKKCVYFHKAS